MIMQSVDSTVLAAAGYDLTTQTLRLQFDSGALYEYTKVPQAVYQGLLDAGSKGQYFKLVIRGKYAARKVEKTTHAA